MMVPFPSREVMVRGDEGAEQIYGTLMPGGGA